jgi:hypothetical protein
MRDVAMTRGVADMVRLRKHETKQFSVRDYIYILIEINILK